MKSSPSAPRCVRQYHLCHSYGSFGQGSFAKSSIEGDVCQSAHSRKRSEVSKDRSHPYTTIQLYRDLPATLMA